MQEQFVIKNSENNPLFVSIDTSFLDDFDREFYPWLLWCFIKLKNPLEDGLCSDDEHEKLTVILETIVQSLEPMDALHVGYQIQEGWMELYFYAPQAKRFETKVSEVLKDGGYIYETGSRRDSKWEQYRFGLYPDTKTTLYIQSMATIDALKDEGDVADLAREVEHYCFFQTQAQCDRVVAKLQEEGFTCKEQGYNAEEEFAYGAIMLKTHDVQESTIHPLVEYLYDLVSKDHGVYEGWSTTLMQKEGA